MALLNTWASQQDQATLSPLDRLLNNYIQKGDAPLAYLMRGDAQGLLKDLNTPKPVNMTQDMANAALNLNPVMGLIGATAFHGSPAIFNPSNILPSNKGTYGTGVYLAEMPSTAEKYGKELYKYDIPDNVKMFDVYKQTTDTYKDLYNKADVSFNPKVSEYLKLGAPTNAFQEAQRDIGSLDKFGFKGVKGYSEFGGNEYLIYDPKLLKNIK
jgi:hypothetical protein